MVIVIYPKTSLEAVDHPSSLSMSLLHHMFEDKTKLIVCVG